MRTPYQLGIRGIIHFEYAVQDADGDVLRSMLKKLSSKDATLLDERKRKLVETELARRKAAEGISISFFMLGFIGGVLVS